MSELTDRLNEDERIALAASYWPDDGCRPGRPFSHDRWTRRYAAEDRLDNLVRTAMPEDGQATPGSSLDPIPDGWIRAHDVASIAAVGESHMPEYLGRHMARHDPARVLADVERTRRIIAECEAVLDQSAKHDTDYGVGLAETILGILADEPAERGEVSER